ncbi:hypothetical protein GCM10023175_30260 [Pseudonocardia xishanensis]|uniref:HipA-like kinase domain-containing protein n=1 Tax=Pseudonocardia xishanensis TaxID=630995 RepID=A0ABP8RS72_9PSEU
MTATRYVTPLREGGSLPGLMEADDLGTYVVKFHGAGQGRKVLVAEVVVGELARALGFAVPELVTVDVDPDLGLAEPDREVQDLLRRSPGLNLGVDFLPGALDFDPLAVDPGPELAGRVLWLDALVGNVDRSWRNANMLLWHRTPYLIDHGATLTFHHAWSSADAWARRPFDAADHVLLGSHPDLDAADAALAPLVTAETVGAAAAAVPDEWLDGDPDETRGRYTTTLTARVAAREAWLPGVREAVAAGRPRPITREGRAPDWLAARLPKGGP